MAGFNEFIRSIQADGNDGQAFEHFCKWFLFNDPYWKTQVDKAWLWDEWPERWGPDCGIDLIFKHKNGELWAVQAKCYDEKYSVSKADMDTFLAESNRAVIQHRLLLASTNGMSSNGERACAGQEKPVTLYMLKDFEAAQVEYPSHISDLASAKPKAKPTPDPHQIRAIDDVVSKFEGHDRGQLIMACGTGKTFTTLWIKEALVARTTLVLVPSLNLLSQTLNEWVFATKDSFDVLCVCSDKSVGKRDKEDMALGEAPFSVTSDLTEISDFLSGDGHKIIFCTYQSSDLIADVQSDKSIQAFDLVIADEAHRCSGKSDAAFSKVLDGEAIRATKRLFTTATPRLYSSSVKKAAADRGVEVYGMDDEMVFGPVLHTLTFGQAITEDLLNDYQVVIVGVDQPMIKEWIENQELLALNTDNQTDARTLAAKIGLLKAIKDYDLSRVISFHSRVKSARDFASEVAELVDLIEPHNRPQGSLWASHVSGTMKTTDRIIEIGNLKSLENADVGLLANARCLSEGVDVPSLDGIAFIDPRGSQVDIIQAVGRAIRKVRGAATQSKGTIVLPVFIEDGDNAEAQIEASNFKPVWDVLKALRSHDEVLAEHLDQYRTNMAKRSGTTRQTLDDRIIFDLPMTVDPNFSQALRTVLVESTTASWDFWYGLLEEYLEQNNDVSVPSRFKTELGYHLGAWIGNQRPRKDIMMLTRKQRLESLPGWTWDVWSERWETFFQKMENFLDQNNHCFVEKDFITEDGWALGQWVSDQRNRYGKRQLEQIRVSKLESLNSWMWNSKEAKWEQNYRLVMIYVEEFGDALIPRRHKTDKGVGLGDWLFGQRKLKDRIEPRRKKMLEALPGWSWAVKIDKFSHNLQRLENYVAITGHSSPPAKYECPDGFKLGYWVSNLRQGRTYQKGKNSVSRKQKATLEALPGWSWAVKDSDWDNMFFQLAEFFERAENSEIQNSYNTNLKSWCKTQRSSYKNKELSDFRIEKLETLKYWYWTPLDEKWEQNFEKLLNYVKSNHKLPPWGHKNAGTRTGIRSWLQRNLVDISKLKKNRRKRLLELNSKFNLW
ncbi:Helicase associated domain protein, partial [Rhodobacteraceae bacterium]|nr:Helicase associated domain protein [Paracoccaceae bacterium]